MVPGLPSHALRESCLALANRASRQALEAGYPLPVGSPYVHVSMVRTFSVVDRCVLSRSKFKWKASKAERKPERRRVQQRVNLHQATHAASSKRKAARLDVMVAMDLHAK